jgi:hypothetical protein
VSKEQAITVDDLVDTSGAAALLGVEPTSVTRYRARREGFPEPLRHFGGAPVWTREQILDWAASRPGRGAGGGRPKKEPVLEPVKAPAKRAGRKPRDPVVERPVVPVKATTKRARKAAR